MQDVTTPGSEDLWIIQPLLDAGLDRDAVRELLFRVSFDSLVTAAPGDVAFLAVPAARVPGGVDRDVRPDAAGSRAEQRPHLSGGQPLGLSLPRPSRTLTETSIGVPSKPHRSRILRSRNRR